MSSFFMQINKNLKNLQSYEVEILEKNITRLHSNESTNPILSNDILTKDIFNEINFYPEKSYHNLTIEAAKFYNISCNYTIPTNGSDEGLDLIIRTFSNQKDKVVILNPTFSMYKQYALLFGLEVIEFNLNKNFQLNVDDFINFCLKNSPQIVFLPNPLAPTGEITKQTDLIKIIESLPKTFIIIDEAYIEFSEEKSMTDLVSQYNNLVVTRTLSKFFGLAGIRLGFVFSQYKDEIMKIKSPYNVNEITCKIAINLFQNLTLDIIKNRYNQNLENKAKTITFLRQFNEVKEIYTTRTNFFFIELNCSSKIFAEKLLVDFGIKIKTFSGNFENFCRISY